MTKHEQKAKSKCCTMTTFKTKLVLKIENEDKSSNNNSKYGFVREAVGDQVNSSRLLLCEPVTHYCGLTKREREREKEEEETLRPMVGLASQTRVREAGSVLCHLTRAR